MTYTPSEIRSIITDECSELDEISDGFQSLMDYINLDLLVGWFYEIVCANEPKEYLTTEQSEAIEDWYNKHCR